MRAGSFFFAHPRGFDQFQPNWWIHRIEEDIFDGKEISRDWIRLESKEGTSCIVRGPDWGNRCSN